MSVTSIQKKRKTAPALSADVRLQMAQRARDQFLQHAFASELDVIALEAQGFGDDDEQVKNLRLKAANAAKAADRMQEEVEILQAAVEAKKPADEGERGE